MHHFSAINISIFVLNPHPILQVIVQRTLASKNITHAKGGTVFAAYCKLLPFFMLVIPGMAARVLWPNWVSILREIIIRDQ